MPLSLAELPETAILCVAHYLDHPDLIQLAATCKATKNAWYDNEHVWRQKCN